MSGLLEECEEIIFEKYLELSRLEYLDGRIAEIIRDECDLPEKSTSCQSSNFFGSLHDLHFTRVDIVGTSI